MLKLAAVLYVIVAPTLMGVLVAITLVVPALYNGPGIASAAILGAVLGAPASWFLVKAMKDAHVA
ncbi:MAG: CTP synthetase [Rhodobacteraceae bacterium]|nr:MAG: CTP synthetase [Paracoccaceae bacterium]